MIPPTVWKSARWCRPFRSRSPKAYEWYGQAQRTGGTYTMTVDVPDGLRCGNVYYGPIIATRDVYTWDAATLSGTLQSSFAAGCDNAPAGTITYPFQLVRL